MKECEKYQEMISAMLDGELSPAESEALIEHMSSCAECRELYELLSAVTASPVWELPEVPEGLHEHIMSGVRAHAGEQRRRELMHRLRPWAVAAACLVLIVGVVLGVPRSFRAGSSAPPSALNTAASANDSAAPADAAAPAEYEAAGQSGPSSDDSAVIGAPYDYSGKDSTSSGGSRDEYSDAPVPEPESVPETEKDSGPPALDIDIAGSVVTVESGGESTSEKLSRDDTLIWLNAVIQDRIGDNIDVAKIDIFRLEGADYSVYIRRDGSKLIGSLSEELTDSVELETLSDFAVFEEMADSTDIVE